jgi:hypothetical protein
MAPSVDQERRLVWNIKKWARILDESAKSLSESPYEIMRLYREYDFSNLTPDQLRKVRSSIFAAPSDAHMIAICLRQIDKYARELEACPTWSGSIAETGSAFRKLMASKELRNLRDVVEHSAEYIAGKGRKLELVQDPDADWPSAQIINRKVTHIAIFGRHYDVQTTILAAIEFVKALPTEGTGDKGLPRTPQRAPA